MGTGEITSSERTFHEETLVFDYYPLGIPLVMDDELREMVHRRVAQGINGNAVVFEILDRTLQRIEGQSLGARRIEEAIARSGVNGAAVTLGDPSRPLDEWDNILDSTAWWGRMIEAIPSLVQVRSASEIEEAAASGRYALLFVLQDGGVAKELERIEEMYRLGVRVVQLTYNRSNALGAGCAEDPSQGLTPLGREAVERMQEVGIAVDLSHCNRRTTLEGIELASAGGVPPVVTHSSCRAVYDHFRGKSDEELRAVAEADGYFGLYLMPAFLTDEEGPNGEGPGFDPFLRHLEHAVKVLGPGRVGIGSDWGLWSPDVPSELSEAMVDAALKMGFTKEMGIAAGVSVGGMKDYSQWSMIIDALLRSGEWSEEEIRGFLGANFLSYLRRVEALTTPRFNRSG
ncbi:MAG: dipeptidase [Spirochaetaceae bacterium]